MAAISTSLNQSSYQIASRTCNHCKASKKKCDKSLPVCGRCSRYRVLLAPMGYNTHYTVAACYGDTDTYNRISLSCVYDDVAETDPRDTESRFQAVFDRLEKLESQVFSSEKQQTAVEPSHSATSNTEPNVSEPNGWQLSPSLLQPSYLEIIVGSNVFRILEEKHTTIRKISDKYFSTVYNFMPIVSRDRFKKRAQEAEALGSSGAFFVLILAILLLIEDPPNDSIVSSSSPASPPVLYKVCKYHHSLFCSLKEPSVELIQAGVIIALYEHTQGIREQAYLTIGTCARMASLLGLQPRKTNTSQAAREEESLECNHILLGINILNKHINIISRTANTPLTHEYSPIMEDFDFTGDSADTLRFEAEACHILDRLENFLSGGLLSISQSSFSSDTLINQLMVFETELQCLLSKLQDYRDYSSWHGAFATATVALISIYSFLCRGGISFAGVECFGQCRRKLLDSLEVLADIALNQLNQITMTGSDPSSLSPFAMTIIFLAAKIMKSLNPVDIAESRISGQREIFINLLQCLSRRWRLARDLLGILGQA